MTTDAAPFDPGANAEVAACVRELAGAGPPLVTRLHPADEMYGYELAGHHRTPETAAVFYFATGASIFRTVSEIAAWRFGGLGRVRSFLDFAAGYGRATRFLARALGPERVTMAEIDPGAVRFQQETLGVRSVVSDHDPRRLALEGPFDFVLAISLFSHLPAGRFEAWLDRLDALVAPGGVLVFSTHGERLAPEAERPGASGLSFRPESETERLDGNEYGTSWVAPRYVRAASAALPGRARRLFVFSEGLCGYQDLYVLAKPPLPEGPEPALSRDPAGALDHAAVEGGTVSARGWALGASDERPPDVRLFFGGELAATSPGAGEPGARREWRLTFSTSAVSPDAIVRFEAVSARGARRLLVAETLRPYL